MSLVFQQGSTLILTNGTTSRELLVGSVNVSQTYQEEERSVKTLHSFNQVAETYTNSKTQVSIDFSFHLTAGDSLVLNWLGFSNTVGSRHSFPIIVGAACAMGFDLYLKTLTSWYKISKAVVSTISFDFSKSGPLTVSVNAVGSEWSEVFSIIAPALSKQNSNQFILGSLNLLGQTSLAGFTFEITKDISWRNDRSVHSALSGIYYPTRAILSDISFAGSITNYKRDPSLSYNSQVAIQLTYANSVVLNIDKAKFLDRWETGEVHRKITDFKALPTSSNIYIEF